MSSEYDEVIERIVKESYDLGHEAGRRQLLLEQRMTKEIEKLKAAGLIPMTNQKQQSAVGDE